MIIEINADVIKLIFLDDQNFTMKKIGKPGTPLQSANLAVWITKIRVCISMTITVCHILRANFAMLACLATNQPSLNQNNTLRAQQYGNFGTMMIQNHGIIGLLTPRTKQPFK